MTNAVTADITAEAEASALIKTAMTAAERQAKWLKDNGLVRKSLPVTRAYGKPAIAEVAKRMSAAAGFEVSEGWATDTVMRAEAVRLRKGGAVLAPAPKDHPAGAVREASCEPLVEQAGPASIIEQLPRGGVEEFAAFRERITSETNRKYTEGQTVVAALRLATKQLDGVEQPAARATVAEQSGLRLPRKDGRELTPGDIKRLQQLLDDYGLDILDAASELHMGLEEIMPMALGEIDDMVLTKRQGPKDTGDIF